jgi:tetratricopeptide (TPR) repeat protein
MHDSTTLLKEADDLAEAGLIDQAIEKYLAAHEAEPENVVCAIKVGAFLLEHGDSENAYTIFQDAAFYQPENPKIFSLMGLAMISLGRTDEAEICLQRAIDLDPQDHNSEMLLEGLKEQQASGEGIARAVETLTMILNYADQPEKIDEILKRMDSNLLAVVRANAMTARSEGQIEMADGLDELAKNIEEIIVRRILEE